MKTFCSFRRFSFVLAAAAGFPAQHATARTWLIDNNTANPADFRDVIAAIDSPSVVTDDVLLIAGSPTMYNESNIISVTKRLHLVGPGYLLAGNSIPSANNQSASLSWLYVDGPAAAGSTLTGITFPRRLVISVPNVTVSRCDISSDSNGSSVTTSGVTIRQCFVRSFTFTGGSSNCLMSNCILLGNISLSGSNCAASRCVYSGGNSVFTVGNTCSLTDSILINGVFVGAAFTFTASGAVSNCMAGSSIAVPSANGSFLPAGNGNINGSSEAAIFVGGPSPDMKYVLKAGSPAIGAGTSGTDMGMFGGAVPYVMSGLPPRPRIRMLTSSGTASTATGLRVHVEAEAKN